MKRYYLVIFLVIFCISNLFGQDCISIDCSELAKSLNEFRKSKVKQELFLSFTMCSAAKQMAQTLQESKEKPHLSSSMYLTKQKMINIKVRGIDANSKNTISTFTMKHPALDYWKVILEEEDFADYKWKSFGVGLYKNYAVLWFSDKLLNDPPKVCKGQQLNTQTEIVIKSGNNLPKLENAEWLVAPKYYRMRYLNYEPDLFPVADDSNKWEYINIRGEVVIPFKYGNAYAFSEGLAPVIAENGKYGYINKNGEFQIEAKYSTAGAFKQGVAIVSSDNSNYIINTRGTVISDKSSDMAWFSNKYIAYKKGALYGIKDIDGKIIKQPFCTDFFAYSEGLAGVKKGGKWGFMDENFNMVIQPQFTEKLVYAFSEGYARFKKNGKVGVIDKTGKVILPAKYDDLYEVSEGLAAFYENGRWGYMDINGNRVIEPQYTSAYNFKFGLAKVKDSKMKTCLIDKNNKLIISGMYDIIVFSGNLVGVNTKGGWGLVRLKR